MATVKLFGNLRKQVGSSNLQVSGSSVRALIGTLCEEHHSLCDVLLVDGAVRPHFKVTLNGHDIALNQGLDTAVGDDDQIAIFPPIAGG